MKRRHFLTISTLATTVTGASAAAAPREDWWELVKEDNLRFTAKSEEGNLTLDVELEVPPEGELSERKDEEGSITGYNWRGEILPQRCWPGQSLIKKFDFQWDGKPVVVERRFWRDLAGFGIQTVPNKPALLADEDWRYNDFLASLRQPRVMLSADGGTALIEWVRPEECDSSSTTRWIISRSGTVLRHRHEPPHDC